ncbi:MAG: sigma-54-dependent Fis family transcriptional regulator [Verrucomicrobiae bacterium]|nr:sigma-54-dependent Fis family transcriptional regulator [Verrucomicrobiae bacterium]
MKPTLLIVDDEKPSREGLRAALEGQYDVYLAEDAVSAQRLLEEEHFDVMLSDLRMPGDDGLKLIQRAKALPHPPVCILMTAYGSEELAVRAMKQGADDYISKGRLQLDELEMRLAKLLRARGLERENVKLQQQLDERYGLHEIVGDSAAIREVHETIKQVAPSRATVLIEGESGTGKELVARAIHTLSPRAKGPFLAVHCAALSSNLLESELFGHERGAFTGAIERRQGRFELADGGTLFLDEIGEIDSSVQVKILRVLESREFERVGGNRLVQTDVRLIAATNRNLRRMAKEGAFREDLFYRLNVITLRIPPLRERPSDIPLLATHFLKLHARENGKRLSGFTPEVMEAFRRYRWPGNVRELGNAIHRMVVLTRDDRLGAEDLPPELAEAPEGNAPSPEGDADPLNLAEIERRLIARALRAANQNITRAAALLGISRRTLHRKLREMKGNTLE